MTFFIQQWLSRCFPGWRLTPSPDDISNVQRLYQQVFDTKPGRELLELWVEHVVFANPRSTDANECVKFAAQCAFVEDIIKALDRAENPAKYKQPAPSPIQGAVKWNQTLRSL